MEMHTFSPAHCNFFKKQTFYSCVCVCIPCIPENEQIASFSKIEYFL